MRGSARELHAFRASLAHFKAWQRPPSVDIQALTLTASNVLLEASVGLMRTLLRNIRTGTYFGGADNWTTDPDKAVDFRMIDRALQFIEDWSLQDVEIAFAFRRGFVKAVPLEKLQVIYSER